MYAISRVKRFLSSIPDDQVFTTAQLLSFGSRSAIDLATFRLVQRGVIHRLARGMFIKSEAKAKLITPLQAAQIKAARFGHSITEHANDTAHRIGMLADPNKTTVFASSGSSSSFIFKGSIRISFKRVSARKRELSNSKTGDIVRSLWRIGKQSCTAKFTDHARYLMGRSDKAMLPSLAPLMPTWLHNKFPWHSMYTLPPRAKTININANSA